MPGPGGGHDLWRRSFHQSETGLRVLDYKRGTSPYQYSRLVKEAGETSFQLPLYLASLSLLRPDAVLVGAYLLVRAGKFSNELAWDAGQTALLKQKIREMAALMRAGHFELEPSDCQGCPLEGLCRYQAPLTQPGEEVS